MTFMIREFRAEDATKLEGAPPIEGRYIGMTATLDGVDPAGYAGLYRMLERDWVFFLIADSEAGQLLRKQRSMVARLVLENLRLYASHGYTELLTPCNLDKPRAVEFLEWLGFVPLPDDGKLPAILAWEVANGSKVWVWRA